MSRLMTSALALALAATTHSMAKAEPKVVSESVTTTTPNRALLHSGVATLGLAYVPSVIVAVESPLAVDNRLYVPVAGPWLDYANRDCSTCRHEPFNKVMLVTDGIVQGIGALNVVGAFLFPETHVVTAKNDRRPAAARLRLAPARIGSGVYGFTASGTF